MSEKSQHLKILLMGDASNCHRALATGLRALGHDVVVASDGTKWMHTERDIDIRRPCRSRLGGLALWLKLKFFVVGKLKGFDVVAIHNPIFIDLRPERNMAVFKILKKNNRSVFLTALGTDTPYVEECVSPDSRLRYSEYRHYGKPAPYALEQPQMETDWLSEPLLSHNRQIYEMIDGAVAILYEYQLSAERWLPENRVGYAGIPIDTAAIRPVELPQNPQRVKFMLARHSYRQTIKGTDRLERALREAIRRHPGAAELEIVENLPYAEFLQKLKQAHVVIDQAYSYTPATTALLAAAYGLNVVTGAEPEFYEFIGEHENRPFINSPVDEAGMTQMFEEIIAHPELLRERGRQSRRFVEKHNDTIVVAQRFVEFWERHLNKQ